jgi:mycofactocin precursor peptide peptidase
VGSVAGVSPTLAEMAWPQVPAGQVLVVAVGSTEQHGHHLPMSTDTVIAEYLAHQLCIDDDKFVCAPTIPYGASGEHQGFPGTLSIGHTALELLLIELVRSATETFSAVVFVNGHGGNEATMRRVYEVCHREGRKVLCWSPTLPSGGDHHAGVTETSVMLALRPDLVGPDRVPGPKLNGDVMNRLVQHGTKSVSASGVLGDPSGASAELGHQVVAGWTAQLRESAAGFIG